MRNAKASLLLTGLALLAACSEAPKTLAPTVQGGWLVYAESRIRSPIPCGPMPIQLSGDRLDTHLTGECRHVRLTGAHNDVEVDIVPGGVIEVLGASNDVFWRQTGQGPRPQLIDHGTGNTFHRGEL